MFRLVLIYLLFERESADEEMQRNTYTKFCLASLNIRLKSQCLYNKQNISSYLKKMGRNTYRLKPAGQSGSTHS